jgi:hypothetical protein
MGVGKLLVGEASGFVFLCYNSTILFINGISVNDAWLDKLWGN